MQKKSRNIIALYQNVEDVGKNIKSSKKRYNWVLQIDGKMYNFVLDTSMISGKVKLSCNNQIVAMTQQQPIGTFQHSMILDGCQITVVAISDSFQLRINNKEFTHMLTQQRTNKQFARGTEGYQDFVLDSKIVIGNTHQNGQRKNIKLKIGAIKNIKKATNSSIQSQNWHKMVSGENSFPNYFQTYTSNQTSIDYSKVSMKKKTLNEEPIQNVPQSETNVIQITPEQFCTIQQLFRTQIFQSTTQQNHFKDDRTTSQLNIMDFNTMQQMFQTHCENNTSSQDIRQNFDKIGSGHEFNLNLHDFNTMQMMFNTINLGDNGKKQSFRNPADLLQSLSDLPQTNSKISQIDNATSTNTPNKNSTDNPKQNQFNTLQYIFSTNQYNFSNDNYNQTNQNISVSNQHQKSNQHPKELNCLDFSTMANLFKTDKVSPQFISQQKQTVLDISTEKQESVSVQSQNKNCPTIACLGLSNSSNNVNKLDPNIADFSTMQNLFKTNSIQEIIKTGVYWGENNSFKKGNDNSNEKLNDNSQNGNKCSQNNSRNLKENSYPLHQ